MPVKQIDYASPEYEQAVQLRYEILRKPLKLNFLTADLEKEKDDIHIAVFDDDHLLGCCLLTRISSECAKLRQMAVHSTAQNKGTGAALMRFAENLAYDKGYTEIIMHARTTAVGFYEKLGYKISGEEFMELSIPHYLMRKKLDIIRF